MHWKTAISRDKDGERYIRGQKLTDLIRKATFSEAIFLVLRGTMPTEEERKMLDAILVAAIEHGVEAPSTFVARAVASTGTSMPAALAAGTLAVGDWHGGAIEQCAKHLQSDATPEVIVQEVTAADGRLPGYGHKVYKDKDPRTEAIFAVAQKLGFPDDHIRRAEAIREELAKQTGKKLPINIDGAIAAVMSELGFDWRLGKAFFVLARLPGIIAHSYEEIVSEKPYRRLEAEDVEYVGPDA